MTAGELVMILVEQYQPDDELSVCYWNGEGVTVGEIQQVARNGGPSLYVTEWEGPDDFETSVDLIESVRDKVAQCSINSAIELVMEKTGMGQNDSMQFVLRHM